MSSPSWDPVVTSMREATDKALNPWQTSKQQERQRESIMDTAPETDSLIVAYALEEMERAGMFDHDADYGPELAEHIMGIVKLFASGGHSGGSASLTVGILSRLLRYEPLTPLTYERDEWIDHGDCWQNRRKFDVFSYDEGVTWKCLDGTSGTCGHNNNNNNNNNGET